MKGIAVEVDGSMIEKIASRVKSFIGDSLLFPSYSVRKKLSFRYLRGAGLEIGALHNPLEVLPGVTVRYVDHVSKEENIRRFPLLDPARIVDIDHLEDGCVLAGIPADSQNFVIANHLLEHSSNPLQALLNWIRVVKRNGIVFITIPNGEKSFDYGRQITPLQHIIEDYELVKSGNVQEFNVRNREHYREFVEISIPNLNAVQRSLKTYETESARNSYIEKMIRESSDDAHFHVFTKTTLSAFLDYVITHHAPIVALREIVSSRSGSEYVVILEKGG